MSSSLLGKLYRYSPLQTSDSDGTDDEKAHFISSDETLSTPVEESPPEVASPLSRLLVPVLLLCAIGNAIFLAYWRSIPTEPLSFQNMRFPNEFYGIDNVISRHSPSDDMKVETFATVLQQVDMSRPDFAYPDDPRRNLALIGTVAPEDRQFLVTDKISTIVQFRIRDYAMERCQLKISLLEDSRHNHTSPHPPRERDWISFKPNHQNRLEVWKIDTGNWWLDPSRLTYNNKPKRLERVAIIEPKEGRVIHARGFECKKNSVHSFEVSCVPGEMCHFDVWQDQFEPPIGFTLEQRPSR